MFQRTKTDCFSPFAIRSFFIIYSSVIMTAHASYADQAKITHPSNQGNLNWFHPFFTLSGGVAVAKTGHSQTLNMDGDFTTYQYTPRHDHSNRTLWGGAIGTEVPINSLWALQLGISYYRPNNFSSSGILLQGIDEQSADEFTYNYKIKSSQLFFEGKLLHSVKTIFHPYASLGLGAAFNQASNYQTSVPPFLTFTPEFEDHKTTNFAYSLGLGIDMDLCKNWRLGVGYRYVGLGEANLDEGMLDVIPFTSTLTLPHLYMQEAMVQISYLI
ncbi:outer membrane protein [Legionella cherrii]|uniref:Opacity protein and related surface antigens n=1 Tax=Legionella cherrii TaxID=28084 RepID=A0ABY6TAD8_9GAMM|nr:outer membrane beta-barrel protein [Legionella cherrii]VEB38698.1 Opacity protein and related surface antigens [Legionella cherrii]